MSSSKNLPSDLLPEVDQIESSLKASLLSIGHILRFYGDVITLGVSGYAPTVTRELEDALSRDYSSFVGGCDVLERHLMTVKAVLERESQAPSISIAKREADSVAATSSKIETSTTPAPEKPIETGRTRTRTDDSTAIELTADSPAKTTSGQEDSNMKVDSDVIDLTSSPPQKNRRAGEKVVIDIEDDDDDKGKLSPSQTRKNGTGKGKDKDKGKENAGDGKKADEDQEMKEDNPTDLFGDTPGTNLSSATSPLAGLPHFPTSSTTDLSGTIPSSFSDGTFGLNATSSALPSSSGPMDVLASLNMLTSQTSSAAGTSMDSSAVTSIPDLSALLAFANNNMNPGGNATDPSSNPGGSPSFFSQTDLDSLLANFNPPPSSTSSTNTITSVPMDSNSMSNPSFDFSSLVNLDPTGGSEGQPGSSSSGTGPGSGSFDFSSLTNLGVDMGMGMGMGMADLDSLLVNLSSSGTDPQSGGSTEGKD